MLTVDFQGRTVALEDVLTVAEMEAAPFDFDGDFTGWDAYDDRVE